MVIGHRCCWLLFNPLGCPISKHVVKMLLFLMDLLLTMSLPSTGCSVQHSEAVYSPGSEAVYCAVELYTPNEWDVAMLMVIIYSLVYCSVTNTSEPESSSCEQSCQDPWKFMTRQDVQVGQCWVREVWLWEHINAVDGNSMATVVSRVRTSLES